MWTFTPRKGIVYSKLDVSKPVPLFWEGTTRDLRALVPPEPFVVPEVTRRQRSVSPVQTRRTRESSHLGGARRSVCTWVRSRLFLRPLLRASTEVPGWFRPPRVHRALAQNPAAPREVPGPPTVTGGRPRRGSPPARLRGPTRSLIGEGQPQGRAVAARCRARRILERRAPAPPPAGPATVHAGSRLPPRAPGGARGRRARLAFGATRSSRASPRPGVVPPSPEARQRTPDVAFLGPRARACAPS